MARSERKLRRQRRQREGKKGFLILKLALISCFMASKQQQATNGTTRTSRALHNSRMCKGKHYAADVVKVVEQAVNDVAFYKFNRQR